MHPDEDGFTQDIVSVLRQQWQGKPDNPFKDINQTSDFSEVFLFFDYDCHHQNKDQTLTKNHTSLTHDYISILQPRCF